MKNFSSITENLDITTKKYVDDNKVTSVDGLSGGTLTSPLKVSGGDQSTASKISLNQEANGQITDSNTSTLFGFMSSTTLTVGGNGYALALRGSGARPTYKGADLALCSDIATVPTDYVKYTAQTLDDGQKSQARSNIGAGTSNFDGTWGSLSGKPDIVQTTGTSTSSVMSQNATTNAISGKLDKTAYEVNKTISFGRDGALYIGKFKVYDTNVTCEITSTTDVTYSGKLVIATQNYVIKQMTVYGDAANTVAPNFFIKPSTTSDPYIEVYFKPTSWSKNVVHIYGSEIKAEPTDVCTNVPAVPSTATLKPTNALDSKANLSDLPTFSLSGTTLTITI